jgi:hypothetical protein
MTFKVDKVNSFNGWDPLKQVILGNCYTPEFFEDVKDTKLRDLLQRLLYETQEDLQNFKKNLEMAGVDVVQLPPNLSQFNLVHAYDSIGDLHENTSRAWGGHMSQRTGMPKPPIAPRDWLIAYGNELHFTIPDPKLYMALIKNNVISPEVMNSALIDEVEMLRFKEGTGHKHKGPFEPTRYAFKEAGLNYENRHNVGSPDHAFYCDHSHGYAAPQVTRIGDTLVVDTSEIGNLARYLAKALPQYKQCHVAIGGHNDGTFSPVKPGHIVTASWHIDYSESFPGWDVHVIQNPESPGLKEFDQVRSTVNGAWWTPEAKENPEYVKFIDTWLNEWTGEAMESQFEVNMLTVNPELVFCINNNEGVFKYLESIGMTPVLVPFRHRWFWDSGLHCLTVDTVREGGMQNYFGN